MKHLYEQIEEQLSNHVTEIKWIDWNMDQLTIEEPPIIWPAILIDIPDIAMTNKLNGYKITEPNIQLTLVFKQHESLQTETNLLYKHTGLKHFEIIQKVINSLEGLESEASSPLSFVNYQREQKSTHHQYKLSFSCTDYSQTNGMFAITNIHNISNITVTSHITSTK